jgi:hypothetical protein
MYEQPNKFIFPHRVIIYNLLVFNILLPMMAILNGMEKTLLPLSLLCSLVIIFLVWLKARSVDDAKLIHAHWQVVWKRCRIVLVAYAASLSIEGLSALMTMFQEDPRLREIMMIAFSRVAIVPTLLVVTPILIASTLTVRKIKNGSYMAQTA